jgi:Zn-dependent peptidase ImmA (M78 family)
MKTSVCSVVQHLPAGMIKQVTRNVWFISSADDAWAYTFRGSDIKNQHLVILSDELFRQSENQIRFTILHEIGHVILGHRNSMGFRQTRSEINRQEQEADQFASQFL